MSIEGLGDAEAHRMDAGEHENELFRSGEALLGKKIYFVLHVVGLSVGKKVTRTSHTLGLWLPNVQSHYGFTFEVKNCPRCQADT